MGSYDPDGMIIIYQWGFGDEVHVTITKRIACHVFGDARMHIVILTATDDSGKSATTSNRVRVIGETDRSPSTGCGCGG